MIVTDKHKAAIKFLRVNKQYGAKRLWMEGISDKELVT